MRSVEQGCVDLPSQVRYTSSADRRKTNWVDLVEADFDWHSTVQDCAVDLAYVQALRQIII